MSGEKEGIRVVRIDGQDHVVITTADEVARRSELRDRFAMAALAGAVTVYEGTLEDMCRRMYEIADLMLEVRDE